MLQAFMQRMKTWMKWIISSKDRVYQIQLGIENLDWFKHRK